MVFLVAPLVYPRAFFPTLAEYQNDRPRFVELFRLSTIQLLGTRFAASIAAAVLAGEALTARYWKPFRRFFAT